MSDIARLLHFVERKNAGGVEKEIERGADVNQREASTGKTALHFAAGQDDRGSEESSVRIVQILRALLAGGEAPLGLSAVCSTCRTNGASTPIRPRARELGIWPGHLPTGQHNAITDVPGVLVGQVTLISEQDGVNTGGTAVLPHPGSLFHDKVPAATVIGNGFGKLAGTTQVAELGEIETPVLLTNTLAVGNGMQAVIDYTLDQPGNEVVRSINAVVGETNDGGLNDIRAHYNLTPQLLRQAIDSATDGPVSEGAVGAGAGTMCYSMKGGIGTSSRCVDMDGETSYVFGTNAFRTSVRPFLLVRRIVEKRVLNGRSRYTIGILVQTNFGSLKDLLVMGVPVGAALVAEGFVPNESPPPARTVDESPDGSLMAILATDAPLGDRQLRRLALRALLGVARTNGGAISNGSGDYVVAFSSAESVRRTVVRRASVGGPESAVLEVSNDRMSALFVGAAEAAEEAIYNSLCGAVDISGHRMLARALPTELVVGILQKHKALRK